MKIKQLDPLTFLINLLVKRGSKKQIRYPMCLLNKPCNCYNSAKILSTLPREIPLSLSLLTYSIESGCSWRHYPQNNDLLSSFFWLFEELKVPF